MNKNNSSITASLWFCFVASLLSGCATWSLPSLKLPEAPGAPDIHPIRKDRAEQAVKSFDKERNRAQYEAAATAWRQGDFTACRDSLDSVLKRAPEHRESLLLLAEVELEQDRASEAVEVLRKAVEAYPQDAEVSYKLALALEVDHQPSEALHHFGTAAQLAPTELKYAEAFELAKQETVEATDDGDLEPIVFADEEPPQATVSDILPVSDSHEIAPPHDARFEAVIQLRDAGRQQEFRLGLRKLLENDPKHIEANILQAEMDIEAEKFDEARARMEHLVIRNPLDAQVRRACGLTYQALGEQERAAACLAKAEELERGPAPDRVPVQRAVLETDLPEAAPAESTAAPATVGQLVQPIPAETIPGSETDASAELRKIDLIDKSGAAPLRQAHAFEPVHIPDLTVEERLQRGVAHLQAGQTEEARREFENALKASPKDSKPAVEGAVQSLKFAQPALAYDLAAQGVQNFPRSAGLHRLQGTAAYQLRRHREAEAALRQSLSLDNSQGLTYFLLGSVLNRLGKSEAAQWHFSQAARLDRRYATQK